MQQRSNRPLQRQCFPLMEERARKPPSRSNSRSTEATAAWTSLSWPWFKVISVVAKPGQTELIGISWLQTSITRLELLSTLFRLQKVTRQLISSTLYPSESLPHFLGFSDDQDSRANAHLPVWTSKRVSKKLYKSPGKWVHYNLQNIVQNRYHKDRGRTAPKRHSW